MYLFAGDGFVPDTPVACLDMAKHIWTAPWVLRQLRVPGGPLNAGPTPAANGSVCHAQLVAIAARRW